MMMIILVGAHPRAHVSPQVSTVDPPVSHWTAVGAQPRSVSPWPPTSHRSTVSATATAWSAAGVGSLYPVLIVTRGTIVANIGIIFLPVSVLWPHTLWKSTSNFVTGAPNHLGIMTNLILKIFWCLTIKKYLKWRDSRQWGCFQHNHSWRDPSPRTKTLWQTAKEPCEWRWRCSLHKIQTCLSTCPWQYCDWDHDIGPRNSGPSSRPHCPRSRHAKYFNEFIISKYLTIRNMSEADGLTLDLSLLCRLTIIFLSLRFDFGYSLTVGIWVWWIFGTLIGKWQIANFYFYKISYI